MKKIVLVLLLTFPLFAQHGEIIKDTLSFQLDQITVSATRYPEKTLEIPYAVSIIDYKDMQNIKGYGLDEVLSKVPGVLAQSRSGNQDIRITIRGFGARGAGDRSNSGTSRGIRIMIDGFPETEPDGRTSFDQIDLGNAETIEVVRSNASALWGNASGGIVNVSTVPFSNSSSLGISGMYGSFGFRKAGLKFNYVLPNGKIFGSAFNTQFDGWRIHSGSKRTIINVGFTSNLSPATELGVYLLATGNLFHIPGPLTELQFNSDPQQSNPTYLARDERRYNRLGRVGVELNHRLNDNNEISATIYVNPKLLQRSERNTFRNFTRYHTGGSALYRNNVFFNDVISNNFTMGLDEAYQDGSIQFYTLSSTNSRGDSLVDNKREGANNFGLFIQNETRLGESLSLLLGGRYDKVTYYSESFIQKGYGLQQMVFSHFTPKAGLTYMFSSSHSIYANVGGGVEVPAGNETDAFGNYSSTLLINPLLQPILSTTYELGTKEVFGEIGSILESFSYDAALYYINIKNDIVPYNSGRFYMTAGKTSRTGIEFGTVMNFIHGITFNGALTWSSNKYNTYKIDSSFFNKPGINDFSNNNAAGIPDMFYSASVSWVPGIFDGFYITAGISGVEKYFTDDANKIEVPSYSILNASFGFKKPIYISERLGFTVFFSVNNLADKKYSASAYINPDSDSSKKPIYLEPGLPRNLTFSLSFLF